MISHASLLRIRVNYIQTGVDITYIVNLLWMRKIQIWERNKEKVHLSLKNQQAI